MRMFIAIAAVAASMAACQPNSEKTNPAVATEESVVERQAEAPAMGATSFTEQQAREQITKAGYADVTALTKAADGTWQGSAMMNGQGVSVVVDYQGIVTTRTP